MECIPRNPTRLLAQLHKHPYKRGKRKEKVNTTTCLLLSLCVHFSFTCRNLVCSLIFFFFCFQTESSFFFVFASLLPTSVKLRTRLAWSTYLQRNAKKKKRTTVTAIRAPAVLLLLLSRLLFLRLASLFLPFSENLQSNRFFFISSFLLLFYSAAVYIRTAAFRSSYFTPLFSRF